jgi:hypothetical protein
VSVKVSGNYADFSIRTYPLEVFRMRLDLGLEPPVDGEFTSPVARRERTATTGKFSAWSESFRTLSTDTVYYYVLTVWEELPVLGPTSPPTYKVGAFVTERLRVSFRFDRIRVIDDSDDLSDGDLGFRIAVHEGAQPAPRPGVPTKVIANWTLYYGTDGVGSGTTIPLQPPLEYHHDVPGDPRARNLRYRIAVKSCDEDDGGSDWPRMLRECLGGAGVLHGPGVDSSAFDIGYVEQWIGFDRQATHSNEMTASHQHSVRFTITALTQMRWTLSKAVPDVARLQQPEGQVRIVTPKEGEVFPFSDPVVLVSFAALHDKYPPGGGVAVQLGRGPSCVLHGPQVSPGHWTATQAFGKASFPDPGPYCVKATAKPGYWTPWRRFVVQTSFRPGPLPMPGGLPGSRR